MTQVDVIINGFKTQCDKEVATRVSPVIKSYFEKNPNSTFFVAGFSSIPEDFNESHLANVFAKSTFDFSIKDAPCYRFIAKNLGIDDLENVVANFYKTSNVNQIKTCQYSIYK